MIREFVALTKIGTRFDEEAARLEKNLGVPICIYNCGICCMENVPTIYDIEAKLMLSQALGDGKTNIIEWCRGWLIDKHSRIATYTGIPYGVLTGQLKQEWLDVGASRCPLLTESKACYMHKTRPLVCRAYGVTRLPGTHCPRPVGNGESRESRRYIGPEASDYLEDQVNMYLGHLRAEKPQYTRVGFLPTMIFRAAREKEFRELIAENKIASAKLVGLDASPQLMWQRQAEAVENILQG